MAGFVNMREVFLTLVLLLIPIMAESRETLSFNTTENPPISTHDDLGLNDRLVKEIFHRLDIGITIHHLPAERALINVNEGIEDGNYSRVAGLTSIYPNIIQVEEKLFSYNFVAFSLRQDIHINGWQSLAPFSVAIVRGWKILEKNLSNVRQLMKVKEPKQLFHLLSKDRVDVVVYEQWQGLQLQRDMGLTQIRMLSPPLGSTRYVSVPTQAPLTLGSTCGFKLAEHATGRHNTYNQA
jgi:polar amino acid transport system substrate-binding protein